MLHFRHLLLILIAGILLTAGYAWASTYMPLDDEVYLILCQLEAEGIIKSALLTTRPLSRKEALRLLLEAEKNPKAKGAFIQGLVKGLKQRLRGEGKTEKFFIKPVGVLYSEYAYSDSRDMGLNYNNDGDIYERGFNVRLGVSSIAELRGLSFYLNPEAAYRDRDTDLTMKRAYVVVDFLGLDLTVGKDSRWWGPGYHGAVLLSNNAPPLTALGITNPHPLVLPGMFKHLGLFRFALFASRLESERDVPNPYLWGLRLNFKPHPYLEAGLQRTALLGGEGRGQGPKAWWNSLGAEGENETGAEAGDQKAGIDLKITMPFKSQPIQLYVEAAGEDEARGLPAKWAYLTGIYLPRILNLERIGLRAEYADTHVQGHPDVWYNHHIYTSGYTYKGRIIGHHMGTDSKNMFIEVNCRIPEIKSRLYASYERERHNLSGSVKPVKDQARAGMTLELKQDMSIEAKYTFGRFKNMDGRGVNMFSLGMNCYF